MNNNWFDENFYEHVIHIMLIIIYYCFHEMKIILFGTYFSGNNTLHMFGKLWFLILKLRILSLFFSTEVKMIGLEWILSIIRRLHAALFSDSCFQNFCSLVRDWSLLSNQSTETIDIFRQIFPLFWANICKSMLMIYW